MKRLHVPNLLKKKLEGKEWIVHAFHYVLIISNAMLVIGTLIFAYLILF